MLGFLKGLHRGLLKGLLKNPFKELLNASKILNVLKTSNTLDLFMRVIIITITLITFSSVFLCSSPFIYSPVIADNLTEGENQPLPGTQKSPKISMSYIHYNDKNSYIRYVDSTNGSINQVSPNYFCLSKTGDLIISSTIDREFIDEMHSRGIKVVPYLSNDWNRTSGRLAISKRIKLSNEIVAAVEKYDLDGVNIDIEDLTEKDRERYTNFIRVLRRRLPEDKVLAIAVAANPKGVSSGWHGSYDYEELGKNCDYLLIMAYDEHYGGGPSGPVASIGFVEESIKYALEKVPKEKIVLGIPFYGRIWRSSGGLKGQGISLRFAEGLIANYGGSSTFNNKYLSPRATITIKSNQERPIINGNKMQAGTYTIWYENEESLKHKLSMIEKYDLGGVGSWSLGQETPKIWEYYSLWLNGYYYTDCQGHWARDSIIFVLNNNWLSIKRSKERTGFAPDEPLTRAEAAEAFVRTFNLSKRETRKEEGAIFRDTVSHRGRNEIEIAARNGIILGRGDGSFAPDEPVTREEMAVMLDRMLALDEISRQGTPKTYTDVSRETCSWSYESILRTTQWGIFIGSSYGEFKPKEIISRSEMATVLLRLWEKGYIKKN